MPSRRHAPGPISGGLAAEMAAHGFQEAARAHIPTTEHHRVAWQLYAASGGDAFLDVASGGRVIWPPRRLRRPPASALAGARP